MAKRKKFKVTELLREEGDIKLLPPFHFQTNCAQPVFVLDELGTEILKLGLENDVSSSVSEHRAYYTEENYASTNGRPITVVCTHYNQDPSYMVLRPDRTVDVRRLKFKTGDQKVVTAQLTVHNPSDIPSLAMVVAFTNLPIYDQVKDALFKFTEKYPLFDNTDYREYMKRFSELDAWLKLVE